MIFNVIAVVITLYAFFNYKKAFMLYMIYQLFGLVSLPLIVVFEKKITTNLVCLALFLVLYFFNNYKIKLAKEKVPFLVPLVLITLSELASCLTSVAGVFNELTATVTQFFGDFVMVWLIWELIETKEDFEFLFKAFTVVMFVASLYGFYEYFGNANPLLSYKRSLNDEISIYRMTDGRGYRVSSLFEHPIGAGMCFGAYAVFSFALSSKGKKIPWKNFSLLTAVLCIPCIILTKMRSAIVFFMIAFCAVVDFRKKRFIKLAIMMVVILLVVWPLVGMYASPLLLSFFSKSSYNIVGGSSLEQRMSQLQAVLRLMSSAPLTGLGINFGDYIVNEYTKAALGYESIWFAQIPAHGILGVLANIILAVYSLVLIPKRYKSREIFFITLAFWITNTLTSIPSFRMGMYYMILFYFIKTSRQYENMPDGIRKPKLRIRVRIGNSVQGFT